jgi:4-oxalocrotonate tautomerase
MKKGGDEMPVITIKTFEGKTREQKKKWIEEITRVSMEVTGIKDPSIYTVIIQEIPKENWGKGGVPSSD